MNSTRKRKTLYPAKVIDNISLKPGVHYLKIEKLFAFQPGQVVALSINNEDDPRLYSIASGIDEDFIGILFDINPGGSLTPALAGLNKDDQLFISEPFGKFLCEHTPAMWIATGTGIAPFISLAKSDKAKNIKLLHGSRTLDAFYFQDLFTDLLRDDYLRFCTTESGTGVYEGRLTNYLKEQNYLPSDNKYYLCGSSQMVIDVREILIDKNIPFDHIIAEIYF